jgi:hypothetical protein
VGAVILVLFVASTASFVDADSSTIPAVDEGGRRVEDSVPYLVCLAMVPASERSVEAFVCCHAVAAAEEFAPGVPCGR